MEKIMMRPVKVSVPAPSTTLNKTVSTLRAQGWSKADAERLAAKLLLADLVRLLNHSIAGVSGYEGDEEEMLLGVDEKWQEADSLLLTAVFKALALYRK